MKIAIILPPWFKIPPAGYGGIEVVVSLLADGLVAKGHEVTVCTVSKSDTKANIYKVFDEEMKGCLDKPPSNFLNVALIHTLSSYMEVIGKGFDLIHDHTWKEGLCCAAFLKEVPVVHTLHGPFDEENKAFYRLFTNHTGIHFISISNNQRSFLPGLNYLGTVYNGVKFDKYPFSQDKDDFYFYIGRFNPEKAPHLACEAARRMGAKLVLAGKVHEQAEIIYFDQFIRPYLDEKITYIGEVGHWSEEKMHMFSRGKGYLYPIQWEEPFGITMVESMACGTPVITFKRGSAPEVVEHGVTGFVVETMDEFVAAADRAGSISPLKCRERVENLFTSQVMVDSYERLYKKVIEKRLAG